MPYPVRVNRACAPSSASKTMGDAHRDNDLLRQVGSGDHTAFAALYEHMQKTVAGLARRLVVDPALADDVTQEVFLSVWLNATTFDPSRGDARAWVLTLTHHRAIDAVRREESNRRWVAQSAVCTEHSPHDPVLEVVLERAAALYADTTVHRALHALTPLQRRAIDLAYFDGLTYPQVAAHLNVPLSTTKSRIRDGLLRLAVQISEPDSNTPAEALLQTW